MTRTAESFDVNEVSADKAYLSRKALALVEQVGAEPYIPFKTSSVEVKDRTVCARIIETGSPIS